MTTNYDQNPINVEGGAIYPRLVAKKNRWGESTFSRETEPTYQQGKYYYTGYGKREYTDAVYEGQWKNNLRSEGTLKWNSEALNGVALEGTFDSTVLFLQGKVHVNGTEVCKYQSIGENDNAQIRLSYANESVYEGQVDSYHIRSGKGKQTSKDGTVYEGTWKNDSFESGTKIIGSRKESGSFQNFKLISGEVYIKDALYIKTFKREASGLALCEYSDGKKYNGQINDDFKRQGSGKLLATELILDGEWINDTLALGLSHATGAGYTGPILKGQPEGYGQLANADGSLYIGQFVAGKKQGYGKLITNQNIYEGQWKEDRKSGHGTELNVLNNSSYSGQWSQDMKHGFGAFVWPLMVQKTIREYNQDKLVAEHNPSSPGSVPNPLDEGPVLSDLKNIDILIAELRSGAHERKIVSQSVNDIVKLFHSSTVFSVAEILMAGSFGKGTMIPKESDVDVVVYLNDFKPEQYGKYIQLAKLMLEKELSGSIKRLFVTAYSVQFTYNQVDIDLLFGKPIEKPEELLQYVDSQQKELMNASAAKFQVGFIKSQSDHYKDLMRVIKYWRDLKNWASKSVCPSSYLLELLFLDFYSKYGNNDASNFTLFVQFLQFLSLVLLKADARRKFYFGAQTPHDTIPWKKIDAQNCPVIVIDPGNPTNNVAKRMTSWKEFAKYVRYSLAVLNK